ncbi:TIGR04372 family glycosyltransferase [Thalassobaculum salexigens]|uniref:TIGR04372 family glycosyltransferase n=1 Tax=Thalassobaculum salexigens TaxID=455360 RepID=UPI00248EBBE9|nr:TIGR04372 family glycosyltransferase [Thalassobaculum salexigens]
MQKPSPPPAGSQPERQVTQETLNRLLSLVIPHLTPGEPILVYVLAQWRRFGHLVIEPQMLATLYGDTYRRIVIVTGNLDMPGSNRALTECLDDRFVVVETDFRDVLSLGTTDGGLIDMKHLHWLAMSARTLIVECWRAMSTGTEPFLYTLPDNLRERGEARLSEHGIDPAAPLALFHTRTMAYLPEEVHHGHRTAAIGSYDGSIRRILNAGYQVVRIGEPGLEIWDTAPEGYLSLPDAFPDERWIDLYVCAACRFMTAQNSGPIWVAAAFGNTSLRTNTPFEHLNLPYNEDLSLFKRYRRIGEDRFLTYREILDARLPGTFRDVEFEAMGIELVENTPEEIDAATAEFLDKLNGKWAPDMAKHARFRALGAAYEAAIKQEPRFVDETLDFYGYGHPFGWVARGTLELPEFLV